MKKFLSKTVLFLLITVMVFPFVSCGKSDNTPEATDESMKQGVYREKVSMDALNALLENGASVADMEYYNDILYTVVQDNIQATLYTWDKEGNQLSQNVIYADESSSDENSTYSTAYSFKVSSEGNVYYILNRYGDNNGEEYADSYYIKAADKSGTELFTIDIQSLAEGEANTDLRSFFLGVDNELNVLAGEKVYTFDNAGNLTGKFNLPQEYSDNIYSPSFYYQGEPVFTIYGAGADGTETKCVIFDFASGTVKQELQIPQNLLSSYSIFSGGESGYDFIVSTSTGNYGYNLGEQEPVLLMNYVASDLSVTGFTNVYYTSATQMIGYYYDEALNQYRITSMEYVDPAEVPDKQPLTLALYGVDTEILQKVIAFNKAQSEYKILITDYSSYATDSDYSAGITVLNNEIASGKIPDMIYNTGDFNLGNYARKGMLADFYELMKTDSDINLDDYSSNVFQAYETDGKLYELVYKYYVSTVVGKQSIFGDDTSLTWEKLNEILQQYPDASAFRNTYERSEILNMALQYNYAEFIDDAKATCNFDSDEFKKVLEFAAQFPETVDYDKLYEDDEATAAQEQQFITNASLLDTVGITDFTNLRANTYGEFLEEVTPVGFPNNEGQGSCLNSVGSFAISEKSAYKQQAWEFVKQFILPENQMPGDDSDYYYGLPVYRPALEKLAEGLSERPYYINSETGEKVYYDNTVYINNEEVVIEPMTREEADRWLNFIESVDKRANRTSDEVFNIVNEEAAAYFSGQKTVDEVAGIIQSRMSIYISENASN